MPTTVITLKSQQDVALLKDVLNGLKNGTVELDCMVEGAVSSLIIYTKEKPVSKVRPYCPYGVKEDESMYGNHKCIACSYSQGTGSDIWCEKQAREERAKNNG